MAIKKLKRLASVVDTELDMSHTHENDEVLESIDEEFITRVNEDLAEKDLSNVSNEHLEEAVKRSGLSFPEAPKNSVGYVRRNAEWVDVTEAQTIVNVDSNTLNVSTTDTVVGEGSFQKKVTYSVNLSAETQNMISQVNEKMNKPTEIPAQSGVVGIAANDGSLEWSTILVNNLITKDSINSDLTIADPTIPASAASANNLYLQIQRLSAGISSCKGCVVNSHTSHTEVFGLKAVSFSVQHQPAVPTDESEENTGIYNLGGVDYTEGDIISIHSPYSIIPAKIKVTAVDNGGTILEAVVVESGFYRKGITSSSEAVSIYGGTGSGAMLQIIETEGRDATTLNDVEKPYTVGDVVYVMEDESHGNATTLYIYTRVLLEDTTEREMWVYLMTISDGTSIIRY